MIDDIDIPLTPQLGLRQTAAPAEVCPHTFHIARAIIEHAVEPFPEVSRAIRAAFLAYVRGDVKVNVEGDPCSSTAT
jgi:hypothetical protein